LAPATSLVEGLSYLLSFVAIGALNLLAGAGEEHGEAERERLLSRSLAAALLMGLVAAGVVTAGASMGVRACGAEGPMVPLATTYASICALGIPFNLVYRVANAGLLATRDSRMGLLVVLGQSVINGIGDALACPSYGIAGAAVMTVIAQAVGCGFTLLTLWRRRLLTRFRAPPLAEVLSFLGFAAPVCLTLLLKVATVQFLSVAASSLGVLEAAAHQITKSVFWVFGLLASESLSSTAQAFLPQPLQRGDRRETERILRLLLLLGTCGAIGTAGLLGLSISWGGLGLFSRDAGILGTVPSVALCLCVLSTPYAFCLEGAHIAAQRQRWLSERLLIMTSLAAVAFQCVPGGLQGLWSCFGVYLSARAVWYAWGLWGPWGVLPGLAQKAP